MALIHFLGFSRMGIPRWTYWLILVSAVAGLFVVAVSEETKVVPRNGFYVYYGAGLCVYLAACVARARGMGRPGWWGLVVLIPFLGWLAIFWLSISRGPESKVLDAMGIRTAAECD